MIPNKDLLDLESSTNKPQPSPFLINKPETTTTTTTTTATPQQPIKPNFYKIESSVLSRVKDFLPKLKEANLDLKKKIENKEDVNIENINEGEEYIQMNLALGILEHKEELNENNIKITTNTNSNKQPIVDLDKESNNNTNNNNNSKKRKQQTKKTTCTDKNNNNNENSNILDEQINFNSQDSKSMLEIINTPTSVIDKFGLIFDNSDDEEFENEELEPLEIKY